MSNGHSAHSGGERSGEGTDTKDAIFADPHLSEDDKRLLGGCTRRCGPSVRDPRPETADANASGNCFRAPGHVDLAAFASSSNDPAMQSA